MGYSLLASRPILYLIQSSRAKREVDRLSYSFHLHYLDVIVII